MKKGRIYLRVIFLSALMLFLAGCGNKFFDPTQIGRFRPVPAVNVILDSLGVAEEAPSIWEGAEVPKPVDLVAYETDYRFNQGDVIQISILELFQRGTAFTNQYVVSETGKISIPEVGVVKASGLTETELEEEIKDILRPGVLKNPYVTVSLANSQKRSFSIWGNGVPNPGVYGIPRYNFRLTEALSIAGGVSQFNTSYIYVSREPIKYEPSLEPGLSPEVKPAENKEQVQPGKDMLEIIAPASGMKNDTKSIVASSEMISDNTSVSPALSAVAEQKQENAGEEDSEWVFKDGKWVEEKKQSAKEIQKEGQDGTELVFRNGKWVEVEVSPNAGEVKGEEKQPEKAVAVTEPEKSEVKGAPEGESGRIEWIFEDGKWVPVQVGGKVAEANKPGVIKNEPTAEVSRRKEMEYTAGEGMRPQMQVIKIDAAGLRSGDPKYNIIIREGDNIQVPVDLIGHFYVAGNVNFQGQIELTGRPMTMKMAVAAAGGLGPLAWPKNCEVIRRIGKDREEIVMINLDKIASGEQPDFFIKPDDLINVGTHMSSRWLAVLRNSFRATYGFGYVYDRNFADLDFGGPRPIPDWFN